MRDLFNNLRPDITNSASGEVAVLPIQDQQMGMVEIRVSLNSLDYTVGQTSGLARACGTMNGEGVDGVPEPPAIVQLECSNDTSQAALNLI
jgi:hypothetical protein